MGGIKLFEDKKTFLFDLDGTLLSIDMDIFIKHYFAALSEEFSDLCSSRQNFIDIIMESTAQMIKNNGEKSNREVFMEDFFEKLEAADKDKEKIKQRFDNFYAEKFPELQNNFEIETEVPAEIIKHLADNNKRIILATNPLFPKEAVVERLRWAGLNSDEFDFITSYENMNYAKPNPKYYQQILDKIDEKAENSLMIGNDMGEDTPASDIGIDTFIIDNYLIDSEAGKRKIKWQGSLDEFAELIKNEI